jgi:hypothetical protein
MRNPTRRSRAIGTAKQGYSRANTLTIVTPHQTDKAFYERLGRYEKIEKRIKGHRFVFIIEQIRLHSSHACSVADVAGIIEQLPVMDYGELKFSVFRQPKRKEEIIAPVWGRFIYAYDFEGEYFPAIILEAVDYRRKLKWPVNLSVEAQRELARLRNDGHSIKHDGRFLTADFCLENVRNTQLYRTLPHEFGHYVHYLEVVERAAVEGEAPEMREARRDAYAKISHAEKEVFAHKYADKLRQKLLDTDSHFARSDKRIF